MRETSLCFCFFNGCVVEVLLGAECNGATPHLSHFAHTVLGLLSFFLASMQSQYQRELLKVLATVTYVLVQTL